MALIDDIRRQYPNIANLPDEQIVSRLSQVTGKSLPSIAFDLGVDLRIPTSDTGKEFASGWANYKAGLESIPASMGSETAQNWANQNQARSSMLRGLSNAPHSWEEMQFGDSQKGFIPYLTQGFAGSAPYLAEAATYGLADLATGGALTPSIVARYGTRGAAALGAGKKAAENIGTSIARGAGMTAATYPSSVGDVLSNQYEEAGKYDLGYALPAGVGYAALNSLGLEGALSRRAITRGLVEPTTSRLANMGIGALRTGAEEAVGETGQEVINQFGRKSVNPQYDPFGEQAQAAYKESAIMGGIMGGLPGGVHGVFQKKQEEAVRNTIQNKDTFDVLNELPKTQQRVALDRVNSGRATPQRGLELPDVINVTPTGEALTTPEQQEAYDKFGKSLKIPDAKGETIVKPLSIDEAKTRKDIKLALDQELSNGNITEEQHIDATNLVDTKGKWNLLKLKEELRGITAPKVEQPAQVEVQPLEATAKTGGQLDLVETKTKVVPQQVGGEIAPNLESIVGKETLNAIDLHYMQGKPLEEIGRSAQFITEKNPNGITKQAVEKRLKSAKNKVMKYLKTSFGVSEEEGMGILNNYFKSQRQFTPAPETLAGLPPQQQAIEINPEDMFGAEEGGAQQSMGMVNTAGGSQSAVGENVAPPNYVESVEPTETAVKAAEQSRQELKNTLLRHPESRNALLDWDREDISLDDFSENDMIDYLSDYIELVEAAQEQGIDDHTLIQEINRTQAAMAAQITERNQNGRVQSIASVGEVQPANQVTANQNQSTVSEGGQVSTTENKNEANVGREKRSEGTTGVNKSATKQKAADLKAKLKRLFLSQDKFDILVKVVQDVKELAALNPTLADLNPDSLGLAYDGKVYLIADNIPEGQDFSVLMHELGVHIGMNKMLGTKTMADLATQIKTWAAKDDGSIESKIAKTTMENVNDAIESYKEDGNPASDELIQEETVAYFVEASINNGVNPLALGEAKANTVQAWMKRLIEAFKDALRKIGVGRFEQLTAQNIVDFAYGAANMALDTAVETSPNENAAAPKLSISTIEKTAKKVSGYTADLIDDLPPSVGEPIHYAADSVKDMAKKGLWYSMFTNDLIDYAAKIIPSARKWYNQINAKAVEQIKHEARVDAIATKFDKLDRSQFKRTWETILDMTGNQKWGYAPEWKPDVSIDPEMADKYNELSDEEKGLLDEVFQYGDETIKETQQVLDDIATKEFKALLDNAKTTEEREKIQEQEAKYKRMFGQKLTQLQGPYAPMRRVGSHIVVGKSQQYLDAEEAKDTKALEKMRSDERHYNVQFFDSMAEAKREQRRMGNKYAYYKVSVKDDITAGQGMLPFQAFEQIKNMIQEKEGDVASKLNKLVTELYLTSLAETSSRKSELRRENIAGLNADTMYKAFVSKGRATAHYLATLKNSSEVATSFNEMRKEARASNDPNAVDMFHELAKRYANSTEYTPMPIIGKLMSFNTIWSLLTKPAYYVYNATQPALMTQPYLAQKHGYTKSAKAMTQAYKDIAGIKSYLKNANLDIGSMPVDVQRALRDLLDSGKLDITITQDLGTRISAGQGKFSRGMALVDRTLRNIAQKVETTNRLVTAISAYRLAMKTSGMTHENAVKYAARVIDQTQGDYSNINAPRLFNQTSFQKLITQFRKFQLIQISFIVRMFKDAMVAATPAERTAARKALAYVMAHHAALAGALGLPAANVVAWAFSAIGGDEDEPKDLEVELRKTLGDAFMADLILRGAPAALLNINVSQNVGMGQAFSLMPFTDIDFSKREGYSQAVVGMMGPFIGGVVQQLWDAMGSFGRGDYYKGLEGVMPSGARNALRAVREGVQGVTNNRGDELISPEEVTLGQTFAKLLGFKTNEDSTRQLIRSRTFEFEQFFKDRTSELKNQYAKAYKNGDSEGMTDAREHWQEMQDAKRAYGFTVQPISNLLKAPRELAKREKETVGGVQVKKSNKKFVQSLMEE